MGVQGRWEEGGAGSRGGGRRAERTGSGCVCSIQAPQTFPPYLPCSSLLTPIVQTQPVFTGPLELSPPPGSLLPSFRAGVCVTFFGLYRAGLWVSTDLK